MKEKTCDKCDKPWVYRKADINNEIHLCSDHAEYNWDELTKEEV